MLGYSRYVAPCQWGRVGVVVWAADGCDLSGLWEVANADHSVRILVEGEGWVWPNGNANRPAHDKGTLNSAYTLLY